MKAKDVKLVAGMQVEMMAGVQNPRLVKWTIARVTRQSVYLEAAGMFPQKVSVEAVKLAVAKNSK